MTKPIVMEVQDSIAYITLNRPESGNAIDLAFANALLKFVIQVDQDTSIRCAVIRANGQKFCVGGDLKAFHEVGKALPGFLSELVGVLHLAISRLIQLKKPVLVLVNGPAAGAGFGLALVGDIVLASKSATFTPGYGAIGLSPDAGLTWHLPRLIGMRKAQRLMFLNQRLSAEDALAEGLITDTVDDHVLDVEGVNWAKKLAKSSVAALGRTRQLLLGAQGDFEAHLDRETRAIVESASGAEVEEGLAAFFGKRVPEFGNRRG